MGGTGLEPVTPSLSSPQDATPTFAPARAFRCPCRSFRASQHRAFARVCDLWRLLVLAPVSTGRRWCGFTENVRAARAPRAPRLGAAAALPTRHAPGACPPLSARDPRRRRSPRAPDTARADVRFNFGLACRANAGRVPPASRSRRLNHGSTPCPRAYRHRARSSS